MVNNMKSIIVTYSNESWVVDTTFIMCYLCTKLGSYNVNFISTSDVKLIARPKQKQHVSQGLV